MKYINFTLEPKYRRITENGYQAKDITNSLKTPLIFGHEKRGRRLSLELNYRYSEEHE